MKRLLKDRTMLRFFKISVTCALAAFLLLSFILIADVFVNNTDFMFEVMTIIMAVFFLIVDLSGIVIYKILNVVCRILSKRDDELLGRLTFNGISWVFGILAIFLTIFICCICFRLLERKGIFSGFT
ncbi:hypothetical protein [Flavobacterium sp. ENC]|uniref:hypothetical protein n=1 Tax=Flavobacterium sp. ENC TaxID=2897330 RepID=UPI001E4F5E29|nr:hypothetical protein [Flavobacterium sp. ENC]MCD0467184.1 hypothetical protein [Flavobacterium sp. ENC]